jgi:hypothetical protein
MPEREAELDPRTHPERMEHHHQRASAQALDCDELRDALAQAKSALATEQRYISPAPTFGGTVEAHVAPGTLEEVQAEIRRLEQAVEEAGCSDG